MRIPLRLAWPPPEPAHRPRTLSKDPLANALRCPITRAAPSPAASSTTSRRQSPTRSIRVATDSGYATQTFLRALPTNVDVVGRFLLTAKLYQPPPPASQRPARGAAQKRRPDRLAPDLGHALGRLAPAPAGSGGLHPILGGDMAQRPPRTASTGRGGLATAPRRAPKSPTAEKPLGVSSPLKPFSAPMWRCLPTPFWRRMPIAGPWKLISVMAMPIMAWRRTNAASSSTFWAPIPLRLLMAAARTLWFIVSSEQHADVALQRFRPWYRHKVAPSQFDVAWACREDLQEAGIFPIPRFFTAVAENQQEIDKSKPIAA